MAGEWIKIELSTPDKPEVLRMARLLGIDRDAVFGKLVRLWAWFDQNSVDGVVDGVVDADVDALTHQVGFASAMVSVGWLECDNAAERLTLPHFERHNGETAKKRALKNKRQTRWRQNRGAGVDAGVDGGRATHATTREEKRREEEESKNVSFGNEPAAPDKPLTRQDENKTLWDVWIRIAGEKNRAVLGQMLRDYEFDMVWDAVMETAESGTADPVPYAKAILTNKRKKKERRFVV